MSTNQKYAVRFLKAWQGYSTGEIAGFDEGVAVALVQKKYAEPYLDGDDGQAGQGGDATGKPSQARTRAPGKGKQQAAAPQPPASPPPAPPAGDGAGADGQGDAQGDATGQGGDTGGTGGDPGPNDDRP
ncbi:MAG: hypothetical protein ACO1PM_08125 [Acidovorax sp.]